MLGWLAMAVALAAGGFYLEGPPATSRGEATSLVKAAEGTGHPARVIRRFKEGQGWEYVMVVEGFDSQESAAEAARALAGATGRGIRVFATEGALAREVDAALPAPAPAPVVDEAEPELSAIDADVPKTLKRAARSLGGSKGGAAAIAASPAVLFRFRRTVPDGPTVVHTWARQGDALYLAVEVEKGEGSASRTWWSSAGAVLAVGEGAPVAQDAERTGELLDRLSPARVLAFPLGFAAALETRRELSLLYDAGTEQVDGLTCLRFRYDGDQVSGPVEVSLDTDELLPRRVRFGGSGGDVVHEFADYHDVATGVIVPFVARARRGDAPVDAIEVLELDLSPTLPAEWFTAPAVP